MNFTSQICTTREQSKRLLALGLKKETADAIHRPDGCVIPLKKESFIHSSWGKAIPVGYSPAWSLHRLIEMMPSFIDIGEYEYMLRIIQGRAFSYRSNIVGDALLYGCGSVYDSAIYTIEWLIGEGYFNKEYLE